MTLVAVTKGRTTGDVLALYEAGQRIFAENRVQQLVERLSAFPHAADWHLIGHLQSNKVRLLPRQLKLIHSVDREKLFPQLNEWARQRQQPVEVLLQIRIAREATKYGMSEEQARQLLLSPALHVYPFCAVVGLMGMATLTDDSGQVRREFRRLRQLYEELRRYAPQINILSMGMSSDYLIAVEEGSTMVRIGSALFAG